MTLKEPSWDVARATAYAAGRAGKTELLSLAQCADRILAEDAISLVDLPTYETSAMDGYGVSGRGPWKIVGAITAGTLFTEKFNEGDAISLATGAVIPEGCTAVLRWENAICNDDQLSISTGELEIGKDIRPAGLESFVGELLIPAGRKLTPGMIGLLAASGYDSLRVYAKPSVALLVLGDEIQLSGIPANGRIRDALGIQLPAWIEKLGCEVKELSYVADELDSLISAINEASDHHDIVITTGSTAHGPRDYLHEAIIKLSGIIEVDEVAVRPGHPQMLAQVNGKPLIGLPGNPQSAISGLMTLGRSLLDGIFERGLTPLATIEAKEDFSVQEGFTRMVIGREFQGTFKASEFLGSAMLRGFAEANGFAIVSNPPTPVRWLELPA